jgi:hypothetical protein
MVCWIRESGWIDRTLIGIFARAVKTAAAFQKDFHGPGALGTGPPWKTRSSSSPVQRPDFLIFELAFAWFSLTRNFTILAINAYGIG